MKYKKSQIRSIFLIISTLFFSIILVYSFAGGDGSLGNPYQIENCTQLQNMSSNLAANYTLNNDIDCNVPPYNTGSGFNPIGNCTGFCTSGGNDFPFTGNFNGANYEIQNLYINRSTIDGVGLFAYTTNGIISEVRLTNVNIKGNLQVGGLVGSNNNTIFNSSITGTINGSNNMIGGLTGSNYLGGKINYSSSSANVYGFIMVGGLIGYKGNGEINNSYATGNIYGTDRVGGLIGWNYYGNTENSYATGNIYGSDYVGGLVGYNKFNTINRSYATGNVNGNDRVGGMVGYTYWSNIDNSYATGSVNGINYVGGILGSVSGTLKNSYATGSVNGSDYVGGLSGHNGGNIGNSYSVGFVTGSTNTGGLLGADVSVVTSSYWDNETSNQTTSAAGTGRSTADMFLQSTFSGWDNSLWIFTNTSYPQLAWAYVPAASPSFLSLFPAQSYISIIITSILLLGIFIFN
ncbi:MAG: hypothetical protein KC550_07430 [Nanoarchaeota archaeon]|nr:hypothetical protein [Nanoarchaeota archaeon]